MALAGLYYISKQQQEKYINSELYASKLFKTRYPVMRI
jgi:hypothetical protein